jgi:hypothetical protein
VGVTNREHDGMGLYARKKAIKSRILGAGTRKLAKQEPVAVIAIMAVFTFGVASAK